ncbi:uracil-DNA glycosylase family protein [Methylobrevis pamukkalensis]|uniref:Uracil DNA glycosylase superfamily protein n=1 Tax=Methylobrevis pamukkalensis TaxID=1439726 RepID=A0A1E3GZX8_9HYPH|nr:uracil-DNA glycosylase family protein [Methylobrevis pamukkalensis]ODN69126.1 Uracil DNA glycosylase superfamily protein [Methylobrevis pamukkalensis]
MSRAEALSRRIAACRLCVEAPLRAPMLHQPRPVVQLSQTARLLVAGQAPGTKVHATGLPFNDASGDRLRTWLGIDRATFYDPARIAIAPMGFCFPGQDAKGGDLPPRRECAPHWRAEVMAALPAVELVLAIGLHAQRWHLGADAGRSLTATVTDWRAVFERPARPRVLPLPHPSWRNTHWLRANPWFETELVPVLQAEVARLIGDRET